MHDDACSRDGYTGRYAISANSVVHYDDDGAVTILDTRRGRYWRGNRTCATVVEAIQGNAGFLDIVSHLQEVYEAPLRVIEADCGRIVNELAARGIVEVTEGR